MERIMNFLSEHRNIVIGTISDDKPKLRVLQIVRIEEKRVFFAIPRNDSNLELMKDESFAEAVSMNEYEFIRLKGKLFLYVPDDIAKEIYYYSFDLPKIYASYDLLSYFYMSIEEIDYYNLRKIPIEHIYFNSISNDK